jgi:hypothetical protein
MGDFEVGHRLAGLQDPAQAGQDARPHRFREDVREHLVHRAARELFRLAEVHPRQGRVDAQIPQFAIEQPHPDGSAHEEHLEHRRRVLRRRASRPRFLEEASALGLHAFASSDVCQYRVRAHWLSEGIAFAKGGKKNVDHFAVLLHELVADVLARPGREELGQLDRERALARLRSEEVYREPTDDLFPRIAHHLQPRVAHTDDAPARVDGVHHDGSLLVEAFEERLRLCRAFASFAFAAGDHGLPVERRRGLSSSRSHHVCSDEFRRVAAWRGSRPSRCRWSGCRSRPRRLHSARAGLALGREARCRSRRTPTRGKGRPPLAR